MAKNISPFSPSLPLLFLVAGILASCATHQYHSFQEVKSYEAVGRAAVKSPDFNGQLSMNWQEVKGEESRINLRGTLGYGRTDIVVTPWITTIETEAGRYQGITPEALFYTLSGFDWPISKTRAWLVGRPDQKTESKNEKYDQNNRLIAFNEIGWRIEYPDFMLQQGLTLPKTILLTKNDEVRIRLVIERWKLLH